MNQVNIILEEIKGVLSKADPTVINQVSDQLLSEKRIFVIGEGRSGFMAKSFAMRLMHLGLHVYVVGETITPAIKTGDVLVAVSGSGTTKSVVHTAKKAKEIQCPVVAITTNVSSELAEHATLIAHVPAATKFRGENEAASIQPLGSLFDQCVHILCDAVCLNIAKKQSEDNGSAFLRHSNLE
ncbi:6-phospho-3-hexuloisomerase [Fictibacillus phosphorivorans]|uniref:6-phospho-3-hexuloisomerase n=1 Tax=Fictibacillus phosphorivorans TaxID=1221500 RepID=UPI00203FD5B8|nr:6-phospho-3-hexuloisomerase [Fictibacillus phosphorivorans]MCM3719013.1 6-phospho-3-hexuloisomerase [Fictibacillus phosphorivorans]MCM3776635.1 6-phospho-3-hexuloisomerase [Fictibacillus phosphorivorans]